MRGRSPSRAARIDVESARRAFICFSVLLFVYFDIQIWAEVNMGVGRGGGLRPTVVCIIFKVLFISAFQFLFVFASEISTSI